MKAKIKLFAAEFICEFENISGDVIPTDERDLGQLISIDDDANLLDVFLQMGFEDEIRCAILESRYFDVEC